MVKHVERPGAWPSLGLLWTAIALSATYGLLFLLMMPRAYSGDHRSEKVMTALSEESKIRAAVDLFNRDCGRFPTQGEGLNVLSHPSRNLRKWRGPFVSIYADPWGHPYRYLVKKSGFEIVSYGEDGHPGGERRSADIVTEG